jgi:hypothetical protein
VLAFAGRRSWTSPADVVRGPRRRDGVSRTARRESADNVRTSRAAPEKRWVRGCGAPSHLNASKRRVSAVGPLPGRCLLARRLGVEPEAASDTFAAPRAPHRGCNRPANLAQLVEQRIRNAQVTGSNPVVGSSLSQPTSHTQLAYLAIRGATASALTRLFVGVTTVLTRSAGRAPRLAHPACWSSCFSAYLPASSASSAAASCWSA